MDQAHRNLLPVGGLQIVGLPPGLEEKRAGSFGLGMIRSLAN